MGPPTLNERILTHPWLSPKSHLPCVTEVYMRLLPRSRHISSQLQGLVSELSLIIQSSIMAEEQPRFVLTLEGLWILDDTGKNLKFLSEEELNQNTIETTDDTIPREPPAEVITQYLSTLTPLQKKMHDGLRDLGWNDAAIHNLLTILEDAQRYNCAKLRQKGYAETEIQRLDALGNQDVMDFSHLKRGVASTADEDYQLQLYLLDEVKRRRLIILGEE